MSEETTTEAPRTFTSPDQVEARVDLRLRLHDLLEKYTRQYKDDPDYEMIKTSFAVMFKGLYEARRADVDSGAVTYEQLFEQTYKLWNREHQEEKVEEKKEPEPPKSMRMPNTESAETIVSGHESFTPDSFPLHENDTWLKVRQEHRRRLKTLKSTGEARGIVSNIIEGISRQA